MNYRRRVVWLKSWRAECLPAVRNICSKCVCVYVCSDANANDDPRLNTTAQNIEELEEALKKKDEDMKQMEERYKKYLEKAKSVRIRALPTWERKSVSCLFGLRVLRVQVIRTLDPKQNQGSAPEVQALKNQLQERERMLHSLEVTHTLTINTHTVLLCYCDWNVCVCVCVIMFRRSMTRQSLSEIRRRNSLCLPGTTWCVWTQVQFNWENHVTTSHKHQFDKSQLCYVKRDCVFFCWVMLWCFREWLCRRKRLRIDWPARARVSLSWPDRDRPPVPAGRIRVMCSPLQPGRRHGCPHHSVTVANQDTLLHPNSCRLTLFLWSDRGALCSHSCVLSLIFSVFKMRCCSTSC